MTDNGTESWEKLEQTLKLCENKGTPEADAQILVDRLDQVNLRCCLIVDELADPVPSVWMRSLIHSRRGGSSYLS